MRVILPGSYDPITLGHLEIIRQASEKHEEVFAVAFINPNKKYRFTAEERVKMLSLATEGLSNVRVGYSSGRVVDYMRERGIEKIVKGYRNEHDLEYERAQADYNKKHGGYETELIKCPKEMENISSTLAKEAIDCHKELCGILPPAVIEFIKKH